MAAFSITGNIRAGHYWGETTTFPSIADFNGDGLLEPFGMLNRGDGTFDDAPAQIIAGILETYSGRIHRDNRVFDIDGDGHLDVFWNVYSDPDVEDSFSLVLYGDGQGGFRNVEERRDINGFGETLVVADFNNDGWSDLYSPVYTHIDGNDTSYLLLNQGGSLGTNVADAWGVGLSNLSVFYRVEGAQAADINFDGKIDMYVGSHLFVNTGTGFDAHPLETFVFDEGANLFDFDNDGDFDLVLRLENKGPELFENTNGQFVSKGVLTGDENISGFGVNVADLDNNGWQDIFIGGPGYLSIFFNDHGNFTRYYVAADVHSDGSEIISEEPPCCGVCQHDAGVCEALAVADLDNDGRLDIVGRAGGKMFYFQNELAVGDSLRLSVLGTEGQQNQHGRSVTLTAREDPGLVMARAVESGSGYLSQGQYDLLVGLPVSGAYDVTVYFASGPLSFVASAGQRISAFADGRVTIAGSEVADVMGGGSGSDVLTGGAGDDCLLGSEGADTIDGGAGEDTLDWSAALAAIHVDLASGVARIGTDRQTLTTIEHVRGSAYADVLVGDASVNVLEGGGGDDQLTDAGDGDTLVGGDGDDTFVVTGNDTIVIEAAGGGTDTVRTDLASYRLADHVERLQGMSDAGQTLLGNDLANHLSGRAGADVFAGGAGDDVYEVDTGDIVEETADAGVDEVRTALASYVLAGNVEILTGLSDDGQELVGNAGANLLSGGLGADILIGGAGDDVYVVGAGDVVREEADGGIDEVRTNLAVYAATDHVERLTGTASHAQTLTGNAGDNVFRGGGAADRFEGRGGDDVYYAEAGDVVVEIANEGMDEIRTALAVYMLPDNVEILTALGVRGQKLNGNAGDNILIGGVGPDTLVGKAGNDTYIVRSTLAFIQEQVGNGYDTVRAIGSYGLYAAAAVEVLEAFDATSTEAVTLAGNEFAQAINGNAGNNLLAGGGGGDTLTGFGGNDTYAIDDARDVVVEAEGEGYDRVASFVSYTLAANAHVELLYARDITSTAGITLTGNGYAQAINGNAGNNLLAGGGGGDTLTGFGGNDTYAIDDARDVVVEAEGEGYDRVASFVSYTLAANAHVELLYARDITSAAGITLTGNRFAQAINGNSGDNILDGKGGGDVLAGFAGDDEYRVYSFADRVIEAVGNGYDTVRAIGSYGLYAGASVEVLEAFDATSTEAVTLAGNRFAQAINGNAGNNLLAGGGGGDTLTGFGGNDTYAIDDARDVVVEAEGEGYDRVASFVSYTLSANAHVELLYARDITSTAGITLTGNRLAQAINGNSGDNILDGKGGGDVLTGFGGDDLFLFSEPLDVGEATRIVDFTMGQDKIALTGAALWGDGEPVADPSFFHLGSTATTADQRVIYDPTNGKLWFDPDGSGEAEAYCFGLLSRNLGMEWSDIILI